MMLILKLCHWVNHALVKAEPVGKFSQATVKNVSVWWWRMVDTMIPDEFNR